MTWPYPYLGRFLLGVGVLVVGSCVVVVIAPGVVVVLEADRDAIDAGGGNLYFIPP